MGKKKDKKRAKKAAKAERKAAAAAAAAAIAQAASLTPGAPTAAPADIQAASPKPVATPAASAETPPGRGKRAPKPEDNREITIAGKKYTMALGFNDLCDGENAAIVKWRQDGANLLNIHYTPGRISTARDAFAISLERFHPEIPFTQRRSLLTWTTLLQAAMHIYPLFYPDKEEPKPTSASEGT